MSVRSSQDLDGLDNTIFKALPTKKREGGKFLMLSSSERLYLKMVGGK